MNLKHFFLLFILCLSGFGISAQNKISYKSNWSYTFPEDKESIVMVGDVLLQHQGADMYCDSAIFTPNKDKLIAYGVVHLQMDTIHIWGDVLRYDGTTRIAEMTGKKVTLEDADLHLETTKLTYNRNIDEASYPVFATIINKENTLTSQTGFYNTSTKDFLFQKNVTLKTPDSDLFSDTLFYNSRTSIAKFPGPTTIIYSDTTRIEGSQGIYDTDTKIATASARTAVSGKESFLEADRIFYDRTQKHLQAFSNVILIDSSSEKIIAYGNHLERIETERLSFITNKALILFIDQDNDTLFLTADTIKLYQTEDNDINYFHAYQRVKIYRDDVQGRCDSLSFFREDSLITMRGKAILWHEDIQASSDAILFHLKGADFNEIDNVAMIGTPIIIQRADSLHDSRFNQVSGRKITAYFTDQKMDVVEIEGNAKNIYYIWEEDNNTEDKTLIGVNIGQSARMQIKVDDKKPKKINAYENPIFFMDDEPNLAKEQRFLKDFLWREKDRPQSKEDLSPKE